jgi:coproporphyrinogen III oxidase-like Fe-S oxidoreductase
MARRSRRRCSSRARSTRSSRSVDRIACFSYAHLPERFKAQRQIVAADLPDAATRLKLPA